jgi:subtilase family serine protease
MSKPDISCTISAIGPDGSIVNGASTSTASGGAGATVTFVVKNVGTAPTGSFWVMPTVKVNGTLFYNAATQVTLAAGQSVTYSFHKVFWTPTEDWKASIIADPNDVVDESNETNNSAKFAFTAHSVG